MGEEVQHYVVSGDKLKDLIVTLVITVGGVLGSVLLLVLFVCILIKCQRSRSVRDRNQVRQEPLVSNQQIRSLETNIQQEDAGAVPDMIRSPNRRLPQEQMNDSQLLGQQFQEFRIRANANDAMPSTEELTSSDIDRYLPLRYFTEIEIKYETQRYL